MSILVGVLVSAIVSSRQNARRGKTIMPLQAPHITEARKIADRTGADAVVVLAFKGDIVAGASYGQTKAECAASGKWLDWLIDELASGRMRRR